MKKIIILIAFIVVNYIAFSELQFHKIDNNIIELSYKSEGQFFIGEELFARVYAFNAQNPLPKAYEFKLKLKNDKYVAKFKLPDDKVYFLMTITNGKIIDDNHSHFFGYMPNNSLKNANYVAAMTYLGGLPDNIHRRVNYKNAIELLEKEIKNYSKNITALVAYYSLLFDMRKIDFNNYSKKLKEIISYKYDKNDESQIRAITRALRIINNNEEADKIENEFIKNHPNSNLAEEYYLSKLAEVDNLKDFSQKTIDYLKQFPKSTNRERIYSALVSGYLQTGDYKDILKVIENMNDVPPTAYSQIAFALLNDENFEKMDFEERIKLAIDLIKKAINLAGNDNGNNKPFYITKSEWEKRLKLLIAGLYEEYGQILMSIEEYDLALDKFNKSLDLYKDKAPIGLYENTMNLCIGLEMPDLAFEVGLLAYEYNYPTDEIKKMMKDLHNRLNKSSSFEIYETKLLASAQNDRFKKYNFEILNEELPSINLTNINKNNFDFESYEGKVIVAVFWSSWCDPCDVALAAVDSLTTVFTDNENVKFVSINIWETDQDRLELVKKYFSETKPEFDILLDLKDETPYYFGVTGLPFFCLIGKDGKIKFIEQGFDNKSFINELSDKIEYLLR